MIVVRQGTNGAYIVAEMTGAVLKQKIAKFRVIPYFARQQIELPQGIAAIIDTSEEELDKIANLEDDDTFLGKDFLLENFDLKNLDSESDDETDT